ncbi:cytochrome-c peroxidase [Mesoflavibacter zeaxanthinifaciens]|uniref:cytochrome-c peroxidase n=1 Tax=Mesoflavibacter zeaxanthinifaciens TaxID=393060 RepID=UPI003A911931
MAVAKRFKNRFQKTSVAFIAFLVVIFALYGFSKKQSEYSCYNGLGYKAHYKTFVDEHLISLNAEIETLQYVAEQLNDSKSSLKSLKKQCVATRKAYKKVEAVLAYYFPEHVNAHINGAPLDHVSPLSVSEDVKGGNYYLGSVENYKNSVPLDMLEAGHYSGEKFNVLPPEGLQRIDELIFAENTLELKDELLELTSKLNTSYKVLQKTALTRKYYFDFEVIELCRLQLIRILSKGITGFDTPGSLNGIDEASSSLQAIEDILKPLINASQKHKESLENTFKGAQKFIRKHKDFESFDRLVFVKKYINPLYKKLLDLQNELKIMTSAERHNETPSWNAKSDNIFANNFLNPYYYSILKENNDSPELRALGETLFFDKRLSSNNTISCASCHNPKKAYADGEITSKASIAGKRLDRNSPTLINAVFSDKFFYDLRALDLENQLEHVIDSHLEFNTNIAEIVEKLNSDKTYQNTFGNVFETDAITRYQFSSALASYVISLTSFNSDFDKYIRGESHSISNDVKRGFNLFMGKANCATCHFAPTFSGLVPPLYQENESEVLGVLKSPGTYAVDQDLGRIKNGVNKDNHTIYNKSFKTTTVRNAALTAPYFHNGAYTTLEEVLEFYNTGGAAGIGLSYEVPNQTLAADHLNLTASEIQDIKAFIFALTDVPEYSK